MNFEVFMSRHIPHDAFEEALKEHLDKSKPNELARKQIKKWELVWRQDKHDIVSSQNNTLNGSLEIHGEHVVVTIYSQCTWVSPDHGTLDFSLRARARFATLKQDKTSEKIRTKIMKRLLEDDYVKPLLESQEGILLCEGHVHSIDDQLEERVLVDEIAVEGVRRSVYSHADDNLSVMELLVDLPYIPHNNFLAHRLKLRILEECLVDACLEEEENELLDELSIRQQQQDDKDGDTKHYQPSKRKKTEK